MDMSHTAEYRHRNDVIESRLRAQRSAAEFKDLESLNSQLRQWRERMCKLLKVPACTSPSSDKANE